MENVFELLFKRLDRLEELAIAIKHNHNTATPVEDRWFNVSQLREYLPDKPAEATIYAWVQANAIPHGRNSKTLIFLKADIDAWLLSKRHKASADVKEQAVELLSKRRRGGRKAA